MDKKYTVLIIDDTPENLHYLNHILKEENYNIKATTDWEFALNSSLLNPPHLILLDIKMPNKDGFEVCHIIKSHDSLKEIPVIFISALDDVQSKLKAFEEGGVDYITKPFEKEEVKARIKTQLKIYQSNQTISKLLKQQDFFLKKIIHEMNTPLSIISLNIDSLESCFGPKEQFEAMKASTKSLSSIYNDLYYLTKKEQKEAAVEAITLTKFLSNRVAFFDEMANVKNIDMNLDIYEECTVLIDTYSLERVIDNTLSNAIKYAYEDSMIDIILEKKESTVELHITNQGNKIEDVSSIFNAYYQQHPKQFGLGLGLSIVKEICQKYAIQINVVSQNNETTFTYIFPQNLIKEV